MSNTLLTPDMILREAGRVFHQKAIFVNSIDKQYSDEFAKTGAKIGDSVRLRDANQYTVTDGATMVVQDTVEASKTLTVNRQKHVAVNFGMAEMALKLDDFSERILQPAMSVLAAAVEADVLSMLNDVYNINDNDGTAFDFVDFANGRKILNQNLCPDDGQRTALLSSAHAAKYLTATKGLFNPAGTVSKQYREGVIGNVAGFDIAESTQIVDHTTGTAAKATGYLTNSVPAQVGASLIVDTGTTTFLVGDRITIEGVNRVHPETKADTGLLQQFVVTANSGASATTLAISPAIVATGAYQNVTNGAANNKNIVKLGAGASELTNNSFAFHKSAFVFASVDLPDPSQFGAWSARKVVDNISFTIAKQFDILNYKVPARIDVLYGFKTRYPQLATILHADG